MSIQFDFAGKKALVTGAGRGIGKEIVRLLIKSNAKVVAVSKTKANLDALKAELPTVEIICVDISDWNATKEALKGINDVDFLVNNAAYAECVPLGQITEEMFDKHYSVNVKAVINITQLLVEGMKSRKFGSIVNISSVAGIYGIANHLVYGGTKGALDIMSRVMAVELGPYNIRVNSINPTVTWTEMAMVGWSDPEKQKHMLSKMPLNRFLEPIEVAYSTLFLLSDAASMITAVTLPLDGGASYTSP